jgi:two-component system OmpR family response regulator
VFSRTELLRHVWGYDHVVGGRTVDVHVKRVRSKLGGAPGVRIETVRGVGYRFAGESRISRSGRPVDPSR